MLPCPVSRAGDGRPLLSHVKEPRDNEEPGAGGAPLIWFSCALECAGLQVPSMDPLIPPWVPGTMGEEARGRMWEETQIRAQLDL